MDLQKVSVNIFQNNITQYWKEYFNQATFFNFDTAVPLRINDSFILPPAISSGGFTYPTYLEIALNVGEINDSNYKIDTGNSTTANWQVVYTQYVDLPAKYTHKQ